MKEYFDEARRFHEKHHGSFGYKDYQADKREDSTLLYLAFLAELDKNGSASSPTLTTYHFDATKDNPFSPIMEKWAQLDRFKRKELRMAVWTLVTKQKGSKPQSPPQSESTKKQKGILQLSEQQRREFLATWAKVFEL